MSSKFYRIDECPNSLFGFTLITSLLLLLPFSVFQTPLSFAQSSHSVSIVEGASSLAGTAYNPNLVEVKVGDTVTWTNDDSQPHTATSGENVTPDGNFDSGIMAPAATFEHTFTEAGEYPYFCLLHPNKVGVVTVMAAAEDVSVANTTTTDDNSPAIADERTETIGTANNTTADDTGTSNQALTPQPGSFADGIQPSGVVNELVGNNDMLLYVSNVSISNSSSTTSSIEVSAVVKNIDLSPQHFLFSQALLKDSEGRQYRPESLETVYPRSQIANNDTAFLFTTFRISSEVPLFPNILSFEGLQVDITNTKAPPDAVPVSDWVLSPNKGFVGTDSGIELTVNDERFESAYYIVDITIENIGRSNQPVFPQYFAVKDKEGRTYGASTANLPSPLQITWVQPGQQVRGDLAFEVGFSRDPLMLIFDGGGYINTGNLMAASQSQTTDGRTLFNQTTADATATVNGSGISNNITSMIDNDTGSNATIESDNTNGTATTVAPTLPSEEEFLSYGSPTLGINVQYPSTWKIVEYPNSVGFVSPLEDASDRFSEQLSVIALPQGATLLSNESINNTINSHRLSLQSFQLLESEPTIFEGAVADSNNTSAYVIVYRYYDPAVGTVKAMEMETIVGNSAYVFQYAADEMKYSIYLPIIQEMINSFMVTSG